MSLEDDIAILSQTPLFCCFDRDALRLLCFAGERHELDEGQRLFQRGDRGDGAYIVMSGTIALSAVADAEPILAGRCALIGRSALFITRKRPADAVAREPAEVMRISPALMTRVLREFPLAAAAIYDSLDEDLGALTRDLSGVRAKLGAFRG